MKERKLMRPRAWAAQYFAEGSTPSLNTLKSWIKDGVIDGDRINGQFYVYSDSIIRSDGRNTSGPYSSVSKSELDSFLSA